MKFLLMLSKKFKNKSKKWYLRLLKAKESKGFKNISPCAIFTPFTPLNSKLLSSCFSVFCVIFNY